MLKLKPKEIFYLLLYAIPNTVLSFGIVYIINNILAGKESFLKDYMGIVFVSIIVYSYLLNVIFQKRLNKFSFKLLYDNEKHIFSQILKAPLQRLEKLGSQRFFTAVEDLRTFSFLPYTVTHTVNSLLMLVLCLVYMFTLSTLSALIVIALIVLVAGCYFLVMNSMSKQVAQLRGYNENYYKYVDDVMKGFKELKLSFFRRESLMNNFLIPNRNQSMDLDFKINYIFLSINLISQYGLYFVVAVILFILPEMGLLSRADVISYVVIILFISGPINNIINLQQMYTRFMVANARIKKFIKDFEIVDDTYNSKSGENHDFQSLSFKDITFSYHNENEETASFTSGPINFEIKQGEIIFIVGGNGSGKSTFINLLTGLYKPTGGSMIMNGVEKIDVTEITQSLISAVFTDNHLFSHNYDDYKLENNAEYIELLKTMQLNGVVENDKEESARRRFSKGQSKRMSLIFALLENKPVLVLDEWAADQDPHFRKYFYEQLLPKLKGEGKTIIAVTHDDAYFHLADRIVKFDYGNIVRDLKTTTKEELSENLWV
ncbi:putative ATP-binding cassette transporter [Flavobacterium sp. 90]|uniref:cyclic peptide export ABC transporter n=1 Tax=unclassified Flavobacterium TaxID=196869 RepID=UPI000EAD332B|nr:MULTISPECIES: cyclic peptide export ABC transporter [unclassified Flavobacterium]RKR12113.1 putative ATP-binding cassette transporter [Flavobacterium sp. 81]TCK55880.1 putative ATP-binding cassette transporter [Flavobacterium sp. 90]